MLGHAALQALQLDVASKAFGRIQDTSYLGLLHQIDQARKAGQPDAILKADVLAYQARRFVTAFTLGVISKLTWNAYMVCTWRI